MANTRENNSDNSSPSWLERSVKAVLSYVPVKPVMTIYDRLTPPISADPLFNQFIEELKSQLQVSGSSVDFAAKLVPAYVSATLTDRLRLDELIDFGRVLRRDLSRAYTDTTLSPAARDEYKASALRLVLKSVRPHGLKYIQTLRPVDPNSWVGKVVDTVRSDLPAPSVESLQNSMMAEIKATNPDSEYVKEKGKKSLKIVSVLGAGTIGVVAEVEWQQENGKKQRPIVVKQVRRNIRELFERDGKCMEEVVNQLLANGEVTAAEADAFLYFNNELLEEEKAETNPLIEKVDMAEPLYEVPGVKTIRDIKELRGLGANLNFMEKAEGIGFGKFLRDMSKIIKDPAASAAEKDLARDEVLKTFNNFISLYKCHLERDLKNQTVHRDLHPGNMFRTSEFISIFDRSDSTPSDEDQLAQREKFMFALKLCAFTGKVDTLRDYYQYHHQLPGQTQVPVSPEAVETLLHDMQVKLDAIREASRQQRVVAVDAVADAISGVLVNAVQKLDKQLIPSALMKQVNANKKISATFAELKGLLAGSRQLKRISLLDRSEFMIALMVNWRHNRHSRESWQFVNELFRRRESGVPELIIGDDVGDVQLHYPAGQGQASFQYEKKFVYGLLGLSDEEAWKANVVLPTALLLSPFVLRLTAQAVGKTVGALRAHLPEIPDVIRFVKWFHNQPGPRQSIHAFTERVYASGLGSTFFQRVEPIAQTLRRSPTFFRHVPAAVAGGALVLGYQKFSAYREFKAKTATVKSAAQNREMDLYQVFSP